MFIGDFEKSAPWSASSIKGCKRFLERVYSLLDITSSEAGIRVELEKAYHQTIKKVSADIETLKFNTAIASLMSLLNEIYATGSVTKGELGIFIKLLSPFAPHLCEEMWQQLGNAGDLTHAEWPQYDESKTVDETVEIAVQLMGKIKGKLVVEVGSSEKDVMDKIMADDKLSVIFKDKQIIKTIYVKGKLINIVAK